MVYDKRCVKLWLRSTFLALLVVKWCICQGRSKKGHKLLNLIGESWISCTIKMFLWIDNWKDLSLWPSGQENIPETLVNIWDRSRMLCLVVTDLVKEHVWLESNPGSPFLMAARSLKKWSISEDMTDQEHILI